MGIGGLIGAIRVRQVPIDWGPETRKKRPPVAMATTPGRFRSIEWMETYYNFLEGKTKGNEIFFSEQKKKSRNSASIMK